MAKAVIGVDIDDVLADTAEGFIEYSNQKYGTNLAISDYTEHWAELWKVDNVEVERRALEYNASGTALLYRNKEEARPVLAELAKAFRIVALTSRNSGLKVATHEWIDRHFNGIFDDIQFAGIFDGPLHDGVFTMTKADLFARNDVQYVIDDQLKHCMAASELNIQAVLFGDYHWNQAEELPNNITRCPDWPSVKRYFNERS